MNIYEEIKAFLEEIKEENENLSKAETPEEEKEALKEIFDGFMQGANRTREKIDQYNDRRWQR